MHGASCAHTTYVMGNCWKKTWRRSFALIVAVKRDRFIMAGKSVLYFKSNGKVKRK